jgi:tetratricopeptide (TPR) repeat protein
MTTPQIKLERALDLHRRGRLDEAASAYRELLALDPNHADGLHLLGSVWSDLQRYPEALQCFDRALELRPDLAAAYLARGAVLLHLGRLDKALANLAQAIRLQPKDSRAYNALGAALERANRLPEALVCFEQSLALDPRQPEAYLNRGILLLGLGRHADALASIERALALRPQHPAAHTNRGSALLALGRPAEALASFDGAIALAPGEPTAHHNRGLALLRLERDADALSSFDHALTLSRAGFGTYFHRGVALARLERYAEAVASFSAALELDRNSAEAFNNRGAVLVRMFRPAEALVDFDRAIECRPGYAEAHINAGNTQKGLGRPLEALRSFDRALALKPDDPTATWSKAVLKLAHGAFREGWPLYEARLRLPHVSATQRKFPVPRWSGNESLAGKTLFVHAEQGLGDTLQFCRYLRPLKAMGAGVVFEVQPQLKKLLGSLDTRAILIARGEPPLPFDLHTPLLSLPLAFGTDLGSIPGEVPYLTVDPAAQSHWRGRLAALQGLKVGLNWRGNREAEKYAALQARSFPLSAAAPLARLPGVTLVSLQKGAGAAECRQGELGGSLLQLTDPEHVGADEIADETAALVKNLDLVITADTALAHLAGALGVPVWVVLQSVPDWRWLTGRDDSPWYPSMRLFRQRVAGDWHEVLERVAEALAVIVSVNQGGA